MLLQFVYWLLFINCFSINAHQTSKISKPEWTMKPIEVPEDMSKHRPPWKTDDETLKTKSKGIHLDGLSSKEYRRLSDVSDKYSFQSDVSRMMKLIIHSLYKNADIFLRELISNSADALEKIRYLSLTNSSVLDTKQEFTIRIHTDPNQRILHITDTGIGMTKDDLIKYLGSIAKSDTSEFLERVQQIEKSDSSTSFLTELIGQFGLGFYSSFLVANKVVVTSKHNDDEQYVWESDSNDFSVFIDPHGNTLGRGTTVSLHLKDEADEYLDISLIEEIIHQYSQFIDFPIYLWKSKIVSEISPDDQQTNPNRLKSQMVEYWEQINQNKPIWQRKPKEITDDEYRSFYRAFTKTNDDPLIYSHFSIEGEVTFKSILYVPKVTSSNSFARRSKTIRPIKLFIRRVFVTDRFDEILPKYLSFIRGIVDTDDLSLDVSRESVQQSKHFELIKSSLMRKTLDLLKRINDKDFAVFWKEYGTNMKLGAMEDMNNRERLVPLLRFYASFSQGQLVKLIEYVKRMKSNQENIFFIAARTIEEAEKSPFIERAINDGYDVLYLTDAIDQYCLQTLKEFHGKKFHNLAKDHFPFRQLSMKNEIESIYQPLLIWLNQTFNETIDDVKISDRLVRTPMALFTSHYGHDGSIERLARVQTHQMAERNSIVNFYFNQKKILQINPSHLLIKDLLHRLKTSSNDVELQTQVYNFAKIMFEAATLRSGYDLKDVQDFTDRLEQMLRQAMGISNDRIFDEE